MVWQCSVFFHGPPHPCCFTFVFQRYLIWVPHTLSPGKKAGYTVSTSLTPCSVDVSHTVFGMLLGAAMAVPTSGASERAILAYMPFCEVSQDQSPGTPAAAGDFGFTRC